MDEVESARLDGEEAGDWRGDGAAASGMLTG